jgi:predicted metalloendopeptidase
LQSPTFFPYGKDPDYLNFLNLGGFGSVAGHEISHGFDQNGRHYDENGTLTDWWTETTVKGFEKREPCFVDQYAGFTIKVRTTFICSLPRLQMELMCISTAN